MVDRVLSTKHIYDLQLGDQLRQLSAAGLSYRKMGRITGLGKSTVGDIIKGKYNLSPVRNSEVVPQIVRFQAKERIRELHSQGLSVRRIASIAGIGKSTVYDVMKGKTSLSPAKAAKVLDELAKPHGMRMLTPDGFRIVMPIRGRDWTLLGQHARAMQKYLETGNPGSLPKFVGKSARTTFGERPLITDLDAIKRLARQGVTDVDDMVIGGSPGQKRKRS